MVKLLRRLPPRLRPWAKRLGAVMVLGGICILVWFCTGALVLRPWALSAASRTSVSAMNKLPKRWAMRRMPSSHRYMPFSRISVQMKHAAVMGEDAGFFVHAGIDFSAMNEALREYLGGRRRRLRGASTISQQLAKNLFLGEERALGRKISEARLALWMEVLWSKADILSLYLNIIELGPRVYGVEAAAQHYYGVSAQALSAAQAIELAATIPSPRRHNPSSQSNSFRRRRDAIRVRVESTMHLRRHWK